MTFANTTRVRFSCDEGCKQFPHVEIIDASTQAALGHLVPRDGCPKKKPVVVDVRNGDDKVAFTFLYLKNGEGTLECGAQSAASVLFDARQFSIPVEQNGHRVAYFAIDPTITLTGVLLKEDLKKDTLTVRDGQLAIAMTATEEAHENKCDQEWLINIDYPSAIEAKDPQVMMALLVRHVVAITDHASDDQEGRLIPVIVVGAIAGTVCLALTVFSGALAASFLIPRGTL